MEPIDPRVNPACVPEGSRAVIIKPRSGGRVAALPCIRTPNAMVISRWTLTDEERAAIASGEDIFVTVLTASAISPMHLSVGPTQWEE